WPRDWSSDVCSSDLGKSAADAGRALQADFAAQKPRELAADREPQAGPSVLSAGGAVGLLERLEDDALFVGLNPDPAVHDGEGDQIGRASCRERVCVS